MGQQARCPAAVCVLPEHRLAAALCLALVPAGESCVACARTGRQACKQLAARTWSPHCVVVARPISLTGLAVRKVLLGLKIVLQVL